MELSELTAYMSERHQIDKAAETNDPHGYTVVLGSSLSGSGGTYRDTELPFADSAYSPPKEKIPERLREMKRLYEYGWGSEEARARNFFRQAVFMKDYEDDAPWDFSFVRYFPTYHDMDTRQLRGYFAWRAKVRSGEFRPIAGSAAYIYIYELLNGVGGDTPADCLKKLMEFDAGYLEPGLGDKRMRQNLRRWMLEFAVLHELPSETARQAADPAMIERDTALAVLRKPEIYPDEDVFSALCAFGGNKTADSPVITADPGRGRRLFADVWRSASAYRLRDKDLFTLCFGERTRRPWRPLGNAVVYLPEKPETRDYALDDSRSYHCRNGAWQVYSYDKTTFDPDRLRGFLHETDAGLRRYLKTGHSLRQKPEDAWADPFIAAVTEEDRRAALEASRPKITIDLSGLEKIRREAAGTRDSLLIEEETEEEEAPAVTAEADVQAELPLDEAQVSILRALLRGGDAAPVIRAHHLMPSIAADLINEALFDEIGDNVLLCEDDRLTLTEDYIEDLRLLLGGNSDG